MHTISKQDQLVLAYQRRNESEPLVEGFKNFLNKYVSLIWDDIIDYSNYDVRCFLASYIPERELRVNLYRGKYHSTETKRAAYKALQTIRFKLRKHNLQELQAEMLIPFLQCAGRYKRKGSSFEKYIYVAYKYQLKRHLKKIELDLIDQQGIMYQEVGHELNWEIETPQKPFITLDDGLELNDPNWIHGDKASKPFAKFKAHERYIMAKYYYENYTDREIARMLPYNPKSIHRIRMRAKKHFINLYEKGELKWIRL